MFCVFLNSQLTIYKGARGQAGEDETKWCRVYTLANDEEKQCCAVPTINEDTPNNHNHTTNNHNGNLKQAFIFPPPTRIPDHILKVWQHLPVTFEFLKPFGVMIKVDKASSSPPPSLLTIPAESVRELACLFTTVVLRGFAHLSKEEYISGVERVGKLVVNPHGVITDVKEENNPKISVFTKVSLSMPLPSHLPLFYLFSSYYTDISNIDLCYRKACHYIMMGYSKLRWTPQRIPQSLCLM
jgi:hypothetical protein